MKGVILSISGETAIVFDGKKENTCFIKGILKKEKSKDRSLLAVGDIVHFQDNLIFKIEKRRSILSRESPSGKKRHIIASNIDYVFITVSIKSPCIKPTLIDRYIISALMGAMTPIIVVNKIDLLKDKKKYKEFLDAYQKAGIEIITTSCVTNKGISQLKKKMQNKTSVFSGPSGSGKSSLINKTTSATRTVAKKNRFKGTHVTTQACLIPLKEGGFCIDTPGIKSFALWKLEKKDLKNYFSEIAHFGKKCKFSDCMHLKEIGCFVKEAVKKNKISSLRFRSYLSLIEKLKG